jgi:hypothetical protein
MNYLVILFWWLVVCLAALPVSAQERAPTITRGAGGLVTIRAVRLQAPLRVDGRLDDEIYSVVPPAGDFIQQVPREGEPATEQTDVWVFFDEENVYVSARLWDSHPERIVANELRRDHRNIFQQNDNFAISIDTMYDQRTGFHFQTNPLGAMRDQSISDGTQNESWNGVWDTKAAIFDRGWAVEMVIPFKSIRYRGSGAQTWGLNVRRINRWKNEVSFINRMPASYGTGGVGQMAMAATLVGIETPARSLNLELKPYAASAVVSDRIARTPVHNDVQPNVGFDVKYGLTRGLTADFTVNTDFAQVEEDLQQVNLTRFSLFFPEKRDFFIEGQNIFDFGGQVSRSANSLVPIPFFSRRIGLSAGQAVPVVAGGRVTGKAGPYDIGLLAIRTDDKPSASAVATSFSAARLRRNVLRRSSVGVIATGRWPAVSGADDNTLVGFDGDFRFYDNVTMSGYWTRSWSRGVDDADASYRGRMNYNGDRYGLNLEHLVVGAHFNPEVGFVRRSDFALTAAEARFSPRLRRSRLIRRLTWQANLEYISNAAHAVLEDRSQLGTFGIEFNSSEEVQVSFERRFERLPAPFPIAPGVIVPPGSYDYDTLTAQYTMAQQRPLNGTLTASHGSFYGGGTLSGLTYAGRIGLSPHVGVEPTLTLNWADLPYGSFTARLVGTRLVVAPTARLGFSALTQFNAAADSLTSSIRMRWEYQPGSELFVVYSDGRDTTARGFPGLQNRTLAVKATRLLRF